MAQYSDIVRALSENENLSQLPHTDKHAWEHLLREKIKREEAAKDFESATLTSFYLIIFLVRTNERYETKKISEACNHLRDLAFETLDTLKANLKTNRDKNIDGVIRSQISAFYRLAEYYFAYLDQLFTRFTYDSLAQRAKEYKYILVMQDHSGGRNIFRYLEALRLVIAIRIRRYSFWHGVLGAIGIVLMWQGVWGIIDWIVHYFGAEDYLSSYLTTTVLGIIILYVIDIFVQVTTAVSHEDLSLKDLAQVERVASKQTATDNNQAA
jgi:hypothetical protein